MKYLLCATITIFFFNARVTGNPINTYGLPLISEVQMTDSVHWSIELGGTKQYTDQGWLTKYTIPYIRPPCSTNLFRLRIASSGTVYKLKSYFNPDTIALLTPASITDINQGQVVTIRANDTIQILDSAWNDSTINQYRYWRFVVRPVQPGHSLINTTNGLNPFETTRPSMGSRGNYTTNYELYLRDDQYNLLPQVYIYGEGYDEAYNSVVVYYKEKLISPLIYPVIITLQEGIKWQGFSRDSIKVFPDGTLIDQSYSPKTTWQGAYIDTVFSITDTILVPSTLVGTINIRIVNFPTNIHFSALPRSGSGITFIIASPHALSNAIVQIYAISGKQLTTLAVNTTRGSTSTIVWDGTKNNHRKISAGTYLCKLVVDNTAIVSQTVLMR